jgi:hypothetical protein
VKDGGSCRKLGTGTKEVEGKKRKEKKRKEKKRKGSLEFILCAEEADIAWNTSRVSASFHATTRHREGSRRRVLPGVGIWKSVGTASGSDLELFVSAEEADRGLGHLPGVRQKEIIDVKPKDSSRGGTRTGANRLGWG